MTPRYTHALTFAAQVHEGQRRKGTAIPYITHPVAVAALVAQYGGDEDQQIAALLHDALEDGGPHHAGPIRDQFGAKVLALVEGCTDGMPDATGKKAPWAERKTTYLRHLADAPDELLLVSASDKLSNAQAIVADLHAIGTAVFERFSTGQTGTLWYYGELRRIFDERQSPLAAVFGAAVNEMNTLSAPQPT